MGSFVNGFLEENDDLDIPWEILTVLAAVGCLGASKFFRLRVIPIEQASK